MHPSEDYARQHEGDSGKTEAWYIIDCKKDAEIVLGFSRDTSKEEVRDLIETEKLDLICRKVKVKPGDAFLIEPGIIHAVGDGILLAEVQQNCNTTYRVYDYGRLVNGKPRELHIDKAVDVTVTDAPTRSGDPDGKAVSCGEAVRTELCSCEFFKMTSLEVFGAHTVDVLDDSFLSVLILDGKGSITSGGAAVSVKKGDSVFIPASSGEVLFAGEFKALLSSL